MTHDHHHDHPHDHDHAHGEPAPSGGPVMLDIGGDIGALIVRLDDQLEGSELPIESLDDPSFDKHAHTGVWRRAVSGSSVVVAVYPELPSGQYRVSPPGAAAVTVAISGGSVSEVDCRTAVHAGVS